MADVISETQPKHVRNILACAVGGDDSSQCREGYCDLNPCKQVQRPKAHRRTRLITHEEYLAVYEKAPPMVRLAMTLAVRTLAIPSDLVTFGAHNVKTIGGSARVRVPPPEDRRADHDRAAG
jgi:hypothetical protein